MQLDESFAEPVWLFDWDYLSYARGVWPGCQLRFPTFALLFLLIAYIRAPLVRMGVAFRNPWLYREALNELTVAIHPCLNWRFRKWTLLKINGNSVATSLSYNSHVRCCWKTLQYNMSPKAWRARKRSWWENNRYWNDKWRPRPHNSPPQIMCSALCFRWNLKMPYWNWWTAHWSPLHFQLAVSQQAKFPNR